MLHIRPYQSTDEDAVWELHNAALAQTGAHLGNGPWDDDLHSIEYTYLEQGGEFLVGEYEGQVVAMGAVKRTSAEGAEIKRMRVAPAFQRRGFGCAMLVALEQRAKALGYHTLHLDTTSKQVTALSLYRKHGYVETGRGTLAGMEMLFFEKHLD